MQAHNVPWDSHSKDSPAVPRILIVEDDSDTRETLCDILSLDGYEIATAASARDACQLAASKNIHIVVMDRLLPDGTAESLLPELIKISPAMDFIVVTGFADMDSTIAAIRLGATDYILKPINADALRSTIRRIVSRRELSHQLYRQLEFSDRILQTAEAVVVVLDLQGRIVQCNPYLEKVTGWDASQSIGKDWFEMFVPVSERNTTRQVFMATESGLDTRGVVNCILTKNSCLRQIRWSNSPLRDEHQVVTAILAIGLDITDYVESQNRALQSERLATIGQTMAALAHESKNALQRIQASAELLELELGENSLVRDDILSISRAVKDLHQLLEEVRSFAAPIHLTLRPCNVADVWRRAWKNLGSMVSMRKVILKENCFPSECLVQADEMRLEQVFRNLFENAIAACPDPIVIEISSQRHNSDREILITVSDNGPGLNPEQSERIFEAFYTTKPTGTGLGMAIVRRIVEAHHGDIRTEKNVPHGARFTIRMPTHQSSRVF